MNRGSYLWGLIAPHETVTDPAKRRRLRALSAVSLFLAFAGTSLYLIAVPSGNISTPTVAKSLLAASVIFILIWGLSRSKLHKYGVALFFVTLMMLIHLRPLSPSISTERLVFGLVFIAVIQTACAIIFTFKTAIMMMSLNVILMFFGILLRPDVASPVGYLMITYVMIQSIFIGILAKISQVERDIAAKASAQSAVVGVFSGIAHGINSPLAAAQLMLSRAERKGNDGTLDAKGLLPLIVKSNRSLDRAAIISKGLQYYVEEPVSIELSAGPLDEIISESVNYCQQAFLDPRIKITTDLKSITGSRVPGDFARLVHAFTSVLSSSYKDLAVAVGGEITIKTKITGHFIYIEISDSAFTPATQIRPLTTSPSENSGDSDVNGLDIKLARQLFAGCHAEISADSGKVRYIIKHPMAVSQI